jgi:hypothetical protein
MLFDYKFYTEYYKDLKDLSFIDACNHFLTIGFTENRLFNEKLQYFDYKFYTEYYKDLKDLSFIDACNHFLTIGFTENKLFNEKLQYFDYKFYTEYYKDLKDLFFNEACNHFLTIGIIENRVFNEKLRYFNYKFYIEYYKDLKDLSFNEACNHFLEHGLLEERFSSVNKLFYEDLKSKYDNDIINNYKFLHITKTGGTSIEEFGIKLGLKWGKYDKNFYVKYKNYGFWHVPLNYLESDIFNKYNWFTIVRNPYDRIISEINFLIKSEHLKFNKVDMNVYLHNILSNIITNETNLNKEFIEKNDVMYAFHFIPMYFYTCYSNGSNYSDEISNNIRILKFENLNEEMNGFLKELNIKETFDVHENKNNKKIFEFEDLSIKNVKLINKVYKKDFKLFNYNIINI